MKLKKIRKILAVELNRNSAERYAELLRGEGRKTRIYPRVIRAEGLWDEVFVVVSDFEVKDFS